MSVQSYTFNDLRKMEGIDSHLLPPASPVVLAGKRMGEYGLHDPIDNISSSDTTQRIQIGGLYENNKYIIKWHKKIDNITLPVYLLSNHR